MKKYAKYAGRHLRIECKDGRKYNDFYIFGVTSADDNYDPGNTPREISIDINSFQDKNAPGVTLFESEIKSISEM